MKKDTDIPFKVFDYVEEVDAFLVNKTYDEIARYLGLYEWHTTVWIGRLFTLDADYGEHWFDNWELRDERQAQAEKMGIPYDDLMVIDPLRFKMRDFAGEGPCHSDQQIKLFWTDVVKSLQVSFALLVEEARRNKVEWEALGVQDANEHAYIPDLEARINEIRNKYASA